MNIQENKLIYMDDVDYHKPYKDLNYLSSSQIKIALHSLKAFKEKVIENRYVKKTSSLEFGRYAHAYILENKENNFIENKFQDRRAKGYKDFEKENEDKIILNKYELDSLREMKEEFYRNNFALGLLNESLIEHSYFINDSENNLLLKARPDGINDKFIFDYKTSNESDEKSFSYSILKYGYHISAAHYIRCYEIMTGKKIQDYYFIVQEKEIPYLTRVYKLDEESLIEGNKKLDFLLNKISLAIQINHFDEPYEIKNIGINFLKSNNTEI